MIGLMFIGGVGGFFGALMLAASTTEHQRFFSLVTIGVSLGMGIGAVIAWGLQS